MKYIVSFLLVLFSLSSFADEDEDSVCPVKLISFRAEVIFNSTKLTWVTATELNNDRFSIERSDNGVTFYSIGEVKGNGTTNELVNYGFIDEQPILDYAIYRLRQIDLDGKEELFYSKKITNTEREITIYPNPCTTNINIIGGETIKTTGIINSNSRNIDMSHLPSGVYVLTINGNIYRVIKQ